MSINLSKYKKRILVKEDKLLFIEVEKCAKVKAYRASYILIWIACAESFKRRFKEAAKRDEKARKIHIKIRQKEGQRESVDSYLLNEAEKYGFIDAPVRKKLLNIFTFRCIYAHPYEEAPKKEELLSAVCIVVDSVLSQPVRLKESFIDTQMEEIFENKNFLDDLQSSVEAYATEILPRISEDCYEYMLNLLFEKLDETAKDASLVIYSRRGTWISRALVKKCLPKFSENDWHDIVNKHCESAPLVLSSPDIFDDIGKKAQDSLIGHILSAAPLAPSLLLKIEDLLEKKSLSDRHEERFLDFIDKFGQSFHNLKSSNNLRASRLKIKTCFSSIIAHLKSRDWYIQNPVALMVSNAGFDQIQELSDLQQQELGRNILQSSDGGASDASSCLALMAKDGNNWPCQFIYGTLIECFVNEKKEFRFKIRKLDKILGVLDTLEDDSRSLMLDKFLKELKENKPLSGNADNLKECVEMLRPYKWSEKILEIFETVSS